ncbi:MAG: hypothetical protein KUL83_00855 [Lentimicrobium sp.]|nr:hypothetical protein [Lentimicrobium sp.]
MNILICENYHHPNQYISLLADAYEKQGHTVLFGPQNFFYSGFVPDIVHIQWPESLYKWYESLPETEESLRFIGARLRFFLERKAAVVYTMHNNFPHDQVSGFDKAVYAEIVRHATVIVHHGHHSVKQLHDVFPELDPVKSLVCPHGPYTFIRQDTALSRKEYRLPGSSFVYLNFGNQRKYKGIDFIHKVFRKWSNRKSCLFTIGPNQFGARSKKFHVMAFVYLKNILSSTIGKQQSQWSSRKKTYLRSVPGEEIPRIMAATDVVFLGHKEGLNSGLLAMAVSYGKPVIYPELGNFSEQVMDWEWKESYTAGDIDSAVAALDRMAVRLKEYPPGKCVFPNDYWLTRNSWEKHIEIIMHALKIHQV